MTAPTEPTEARIPHDLLWFHPTTWQTEGGELERTTDYGTDLRRRELWRQAQDAWANDHGMDRRDFELARDRQRHARRHERAEA